MSQTKSLTWWRARLSFFLPQEKAKIPNITSRLLASLSIAKQSVGSHTKFRQLAITALCITLSACQFQPLYATRPQDANLNGFLSSIEVTTENTRLGQSLRAAIEDRLSSSATAPAFRLNIVLARRLTAAGITGTGIASRYNVQLSASYALTRNADRKIFTEGDTHAIAGYNVLLSDYATYASEQDANERAVAEIAEEIRARLATAFYAKESR